ncbi:MAG: SDR family oxidoreductase [Planctomycetota bacterium]|nr:SDR family oxidoreductase [Planctomycetota bacterium]
MSKTIVITGCSTGFGREAALRFARRGDRVFATMRGVEGKNAARAAELLAAAEAEQLALSVLELDVCDTASADAAAEAVLAESGAPDVVINNAGVMYVGVTEAFDPSELSAQLDVNVVGVHRVCRAFLPAMRAANRGLIINVSSVAGRLAIPTFGIYHASKWALEGYSASLRYELASSGVDVVLVEPGPFRTELFGQSPAPKDAEGRAASYPAAFTSAMEGMGAMFDTVLSDPEAPTDPALVVDLFLELTDMTPGSRPLRQAVGLDFGVEDYNQPAKDFDASVLAAMELTSIARIGG